MAGNGGKRLGAGRPKGTIGKSRLEADKAIEYIRERVTAELEPILDKQIEQALAGDNNARVDLYNRAYGKPKESVEVSGIEFIFNGTTKN